MTTATASETLLKQLIDNRGTRYTFLADALGVSPSHIRRMLINERPITSKSADWLADFYGVPVSLFYEEMGSSSGRLKLGALYLVAPKLLTRKTAPAQETSGAGRQA